jgi:hypothetical protein
MANQWCLSARSEASFRLHSARFLMPRVVIYRMTGLIDEGFLIAAPLHDKSLASC